MRNHKYKDMPNQVKKEIGLHPSFIVSNLKLH